MKAFQMKKVMIALDYDPTAQKIAEIGFTLATAMKAEVVLLHVITDFKYYSSEAYSPIVGYTGMLATSPTLQVDTASLIRASNHFLDRIKEHLGDMAIKSVVQESDFAESIITAAKMQQADIIVMGSHSKRWLENILIGSVTEKVLHGSNIPLFIVPTRK